MSDQQKCVGIKKLTANARQFLCLLSTSVPSEHLFSSPAQACIFGKTLHNLLTISSGQCQLCR